MCDGVPRIALSVEEFRQSIGVGRRKGYELARKIGVYADGRLIVPVTSIERARESLRRGVLVNAYDIEAMNARIAARWTKANQYETVPVRPPSWAASVVDADGELIAVHRETAAPYPLDIHSDLSPEDRAVIVGRRILAAGGTANEVIRFLDAFELPQYARDRQARLVREATS